MISKVTRMPGLSKATELTLELTELVKRRTANLTLSQRETVLAGLIGNLEDYANEVEDEIGENDESE